MLHPIAFTITVTKIRHSMPMMVAVTVVIKVLIVMVVMVAQ